MRTIRFARRRRPEDESAESVLLLDCRLRAKADDGTLAFGQSG